MFRDLRRLGTALSFWLAAALSACASSPAAPVVVTPAAAPSSTTGGTSDALWAIRASEDVRQIVPSWLPAGDAPPASTTGATLVLVTDHALIAVDAASGEVQWQRQFPRKLAADDLFPLPETALALLRQGKEDWLVSLYSGQTLWTSATLPLKEPSVYLPILHAPQLLVAGRDSAGQKVLLGADLRTGTTLWTSEMWEHDPARIVGGTRVARTGLYQPALPLRDSTVILWLTGDGPSRVNRITGSVRWTAAELARKAVPRVALTTFEQEHLERTTQPRWLVAEGTLYAPFENRLAAIDVQSGRVMWTARLNAPISVLAPGPQGVLVQGWDNRDHAFLDLRDRTSGRSLWKRSVRGLKDAGFFTPGGDPIGVADGEILRISAQTGEVRPLGDLEFKGGERPIVARELGDRILLLSEQNLATLDSAGRLLELTHVPNPDKLALRVYGTVMKWALTASMAMTAYQTLQAARAGLLADPEAGERLRESMREVGELREENRSDLARAALSIGHTALTEDAAFFLTQEPHESDEKRWLLLGLDLQTHRAVRRIWLSTKPTSYHIDPWSDLVYVIYPGGTVEALPLAGP